MVAACQGQLTVTVTPGYVFAPGEVPTTATLNAIGQPSIFISGTISGTVGLGAKTVTGVHLADSVVDGITLDFNGNSPRQIEIKNAGVGQTQIAAGAVAQTNILAMAVARTNIQAAAVDTTNLTFGIVGMVITYAANTAPTGWLECDGSAVSRTTYAALFAALGTAWGVGDGSTTFNLPDLRGEFVRGWDHGKGTDSGRTFASHQSDAFKDHTHTLSPDYVKYSGGSQGLLGSGSQGDGGGVTGTVSSPNNGGTETRPRNFALMYVIKF